MFFTLLFLAVYSASAAVLLPRSWMVFWKTDRFFTSLALLLILATATQVSLRPSNEGLGFAAGLIVLVLGVTIAQVFHFTSRESLQDFLLIALSVIVGTNYIWLLSNENVDVRLTYSLAIFAPVLMQIGLERQAFFGSAYLLTWGVYVFSAWQELRASSFAVAVVLTVWALNRRAGWGVKAVTLLATLAAAIGLWRVLILKPIFYQGELYVSARDELARSALTRVQGGSVYETAGQVLFGFGPGFGKEQVTQAGFAHADLHSTMMTLFLDYGFVVFALTLAFFTAGLVRISGLGLFPIQPVSLLRWAPVMMVGGIFAAFAFIYDVVVVFETSCSFIVALFILSSEPMPRSVERQSLEKSGS